jgi:ACT domain-containing protein
MNEITRSSRVTIALQVIQRMNEGLSVKEACSEVGMPRSTHYYIIVRDTEVIALFQDMVTANHRERLWTILVNHVNDNRASH